MKIGELSKATNIPVETIRYYENEGLLPEPSRDSNNYRQYEKNHLDRLLFIRNCRAFNMTHDEIRQLLTAIETPNECCNSINNIIASHITHITTRINELLTLQEKLVDLQESCSINHPAQTCTIIEGLNQMDITYFDHTKTHL